MKDQIYNTLLMEKSYLGNGLGLIYGTKLILDQSECSMHTNLYRSVSLSIEDIVSIKNIYDS